MTQLPQSGSLEQVLRYLRLLALSNAFTIEMTRVANYMGALAFQPADLVDADGNAFSLGTLNDTEFGDPNDWVPKAFTRVRITQQLKPVPPYPHLELFGAAGRMQMAGAGPFEFDTGEAAGWVYLVDAVTVADGDRPEVAARRALALSQGFERLVRRNEHLGGLVQLIAAEGPPSPGGEVERAKAGLISGVLQRFHVYAVNHIY